MGFYTVVVFNNDNQSSFEKDPEVGKKILDAIRSAVLQKDLPVQIMTSGGVIGEVVAQSHADYAAILACTTAGTKYLGSCSWNDREHYALDKLAEQHGYEIRRRRRPRLRDPECCKDCAQDIEREKARARKAPDDKG